MLKPETKRILTIAIADIPAAREVIQELDQIGILQDEVDQIISESGIEPVQDSHVLSSGDISSGFIDLAQLPNLPEEVLVSVAGGCGQQYGLDFIVTGKRLSWSGLGMETVLSEADALLISYTSLLG